MEGHHEAEQTHGLGQSEAQNSVREQLLLQAGVPCVSDDERSKDGSNPSSGSSHSNSGGSSSDELCSGVNVLAGYASGQSSGLNSRWNLHGDARELDDEPSGGVGEGVGVHGGVYRNVSFKVLYSSSVAW